MLVHPSRPPHTKEIFGILVEEQLGLFRLTPENASYTPFDNYDLNVLYEFCTTSLRLLTNRSTRSALFTFLVELQVSNSGSFFNDKFTNAASPRLLMQRSCKAGRADARERVAAIQWRFLRRQKLASRWEGIRMCFRIPKVSLWRMWVWECLRKHSHG